MLALILAAALGQALEPYDPARGPIYSQPASMGGLAYFEAFPASGAGVGAACACTVPTGAKGETLTFSRVSASTCLKTVGVEPQLVADGDMVTCASGQPVVMPGADGTSINGLNVESTRTNSILRSQEFDNSGVWSKGGSGVAAPTITANYAMAPDGTMTAERIQVAACPANTNASEVTQSVANGSYNQSIYLRGTSGSGSIRLCAYNSGQACQVCNFVATGWTRCERRWVSGTHATFAFGCIHNTAVYPGSGDTGAADFLAWGAQMEPSTFATSYIKTDGATATRASTSASFNIGLSTGADFSFAETFVSANPAGICAGFYPYASTRGPNGYTCFNNSFVWRVTSTASADSTSQTFTSYAWNSGIRWGGSWNRATSVATVYVNGIAGTPSASTPGVTSNTFTSLTLELGLHKRICAHPNLERCR